MIVYPTATYLVSTLVQQTQYELVDWSPKLANQLITVLRALFAEQEAQMRFPNSSFKEDWVWDAAYRMALIGSPEVVDAYAELINQALNAGKADVQHLESWFHDHEDRLQLRVTILPPLANLQSNYLIEISDLYQSNGIYLWLVEDSARFSVYPLPASDYGGYGWPYSNDPWLPGEDDSPDTRDKARFIAGYILLLTVRSIHPEMRCA